MDQKVGLMIIFFSLLKKIHMNFVLIAVVISAVLNFGVSIVEIGLLNNGK